MNEHKQQKPSLGAVREIIYIVELLIVMCISSGVIWLVFR